MVTGETFKLSTMQRYSSYRVYTYQKLISYSLAKLQATVLLTYAQFVFSILTSLKLHSCQLESFSSLVYFLLLFYNEVS